MTNEEKMYLAIRHFPDKKRPCIVLEQGNSCVVLGYLTDKKREKWLRKAMMTDEPYQIAIRIVNSYDLNEIIEEGTEE